MPAVLELARFIIRKVLNENELNYSVLKNSRHDLQECNKKYGIPSKKLKVPSYNLQAIIQGQTNNIIYVPLKAILLFETFFSKIKNKNIWDTLYSRNKTLFFQTFLLITF